MGMGLGCQGGRGSTEAPGSTRAPGRSTPWRAHLKNGTQHGLTHLITVLCMLRNVWSEERRIASAHSHDGCVCPPLVITQHAAMQGPSPRAPWCNQWDSAGPQLCCILTA